MKVRFIPLLLALLLVIAAWTPAAAQVQKSPSFVDKVDVTGEVVTFQTKEGNYVDVTMRVAGPDDFWLEHRFSGEETPSLRVKTEKGITLPNGTYTIEMTASPNITDKQRAALDGARKKGDRYAMGKLMKEIGLDPVAMVYSTSLGVAEGRFVNPEGEHEDETAGKDMGVLEQAPTAPSIDIDSVELTGQRWDAAYLPNQQTVAADATAATAQQALLVSDQNAPPFARAAQAPTWHEATFQNAAANVTYQGYLRPLAYDGQGKLFQAVFRKADAPAEEAWDQGYFLHEDGQVRFLTHARMTAPAQPGLFDYVAQGDTPPAAALPDQVILDDLIVDGSACVGQDCVNGESFGFDTIRIKENNLRIKAQDTSSTASFPTQDWQLTFNDSSNGGANKFSIDAISPVANTPFTIEAGAPSHSLYVEDGGRIGFGTSTPVVDLHVKSGNTPTLRLEQDGSSGFGAQTWDVAGNEANFFIRDATSGSTLPFRIFPGAPSNALTIEGSGEIGMGTTSPTGNLHLSENGAVQIRLDNTGQQAWDLNSASNGSFRISDDEVAPNVEFELDIAGNLTVSGNLVSGGAGNCASPNPPCDGVFLPDYEVPSIEEHAAAMWKNHYLPAIGATLEGEPINLTTKTQGILNELEHAHIYIEQLHKRLKALETRLGDIEAEK